jgi:hypothetical protein
MDSTKRKLRALVVRISDVANKNLQHQNNELSKKLDELRQGLDTINDVRNKSDETLNKLAELESKVSVIEQLAKVNFDNTQCTLLQVEAMRRSPEYQAVFEDKKPLISIRIATYNRSKILIENAVSTILKQTYQNFEVVVVGDHCTDDTEERIKKLHDPRFTFYNLPTRTVYPEDRIKKWQVIGAPAMNAAAELADGAWIAPIDDDDFFTDDHLEKLLKLALEKRCEFVYGAMNQHNQVTGEQKKIWSSPPFFGGVSINGALYLKSLDRIFKYDVHSYIVDEAADWVMLRRMMESGVRITSTSDVVGTLNMIPPGHASKDY